MAEGKYHRRSYRLKDYDYTQPGAYFVTICTKDRVCSLASIKDGHLVLTEIGETANNRWLEIPEHFPRMRLDAYVIMPNHLHGLIFIEAISNSVGVQDLEPLRNRFQHIQPQSIGSAMRSFKAAVSSECKQTIDADFRWQRNFYDHVIRSEKELECIRNYIMRNQLLWSSDVENVERTDRTLDSGAYYQKVYG